MKTFKEYQKLAARTMKPNRTLKEDLADYALGLSEAGEAQNKIKKYIYHGHDLNIKDIVEELGDTLWYISAIAHVLDTPLEEVAEYNIRKLKKRYPEGYSDEKSRRRIIDVEKGDVPVE